MSNAGSMLTGKVRVSLDALSSDVSVTLTDGEGRHLAGLALGKGEHRVLGLPVELRADEDNDLEYWVEARHANGRVERQRLNLSVPLSPERQPEMVGDALQYRGAVEPEGGRQ